MLKMKLIVVAEDAVTDGERNSVSLFNVIEGGQSPGFPLVFARLVVVAITERDIESDPNEVDLRVRIGVAGGKKLSDVTTRISYQIAFSMGEATNQSDRFSCEGYRCAYLGYSGTAFCIPTP